MRGAHLTQPVKEHVEVGQHGAPGHLDDVVEGLAGVVAQPAVRVIEAGQHRLDQLLQVEARVLWWGRRTNSSEQAGPQLPLPADIPAPLGGLRPLCGARFKDPLQAGLPGQGPRQGTWLHDLATSGVETTAIKYRHATSCWVSDPSQGHAGVSVPPGPPCPVRWSRRPGR